MLAEMGNMQDMDWFEEKEKKIKVYMQKLNTFKIFYM